MDKFVIQVVTRKASSRNGSTIVRIPKQTYEQLEDVKQKTGLSMTKLMAMCVDFALDRLDIQYVEDDEF